MQYMYGNVLNIYCFNIQETPSLRNLFSFERKGWLNLVWDWSRSILDYYKSSIMIISGEGGTVSCGHLAQISQSPRNKNKIFFFSISPWVYNEASRGGNFPTKYPPNSSVLLQRMWCWLLSVTSNQGKWPGPRARITVLVSHTRNRENEWNLSEGSQLSKKWLSWHGVKPRKAFLWICWSACQPQIAVRYTWDIIPQVSFVNCLLTDHPEWSSWD